MQTFDQSIFRLYEQQLISHEEALRWASNVDEFKLKVQGITTTADMARDQMARRRRATQMHAARLRDHARLRAHDAASTRTQLMRDAVRTDAYVAGPAGCSPAASCPKRRCATRLARREFDADDIDAAIARLQARARARRPPHGAAPAPGPRRT